MLVIDSKETLLELVEKKQGIVSIKFSSFSSEENKNLENQINHLINDCGCTSGKSLLFLLLPISIVISTFFYVLIKHLGYSIIFFFVIQFIIGITGKLFRKTENKKRLQQIIETTYNKLKNIEKCRN